MRTSRPRRARFGGVAGRRTGPVRERERSTSVGSDEHRGAVVAMVGNDAPRSAPAPSPATASSDVASGRSACTTTTRARPVRACPRAARRRPRASSDPGSSMHVRARARRPTRATSGALDTTTIGRVAGRGDDALGHRARERGASVVVEDAPARRALPSTNERNGTTIAACGSRERRGSAMSCVCYRPWMPSIPARRRVFWPWLRYGLRWTIEGADAHPDARVR